MSNNQTEDTPHPVFNLDYRAKKNGKFKKLSVKDEAHIEKKCAGYSEMTLPDFEQGKARPRIWHGDAPGRVPAGLSQDITDGPLYRVNFGNKMRVFAYRQDNVFFVVWIDGTHQSG